MLGRCCWALQILFLGFVVSRIVVGTTASSTQRIIHGMSNMDIKQSVLSRFSYGELETLVKLVDYISAEESIANLV